MRTFEKHLKKKCKNKHFAVIYMDAVTKLPKLKKVDQKKLEREVRKNSDAVRKMLPELLKEHRGEYIVYHNGEYYFLEGLAKAVEFGYARFGADVGFCCVELTDREIVLSQFVKL